MGVIQSTNKYNFNSYFFAFKKKSVAKKTVHSDIEKLFGSVQRPVRELLAASREILAASRDLSKRPRVFGSIQRDFGSIQRAFGRSQRAFGSGQGPFAASKELFAVVRELWAAARQHLAAFKDLLAAARQHLVAARDHLETARGLLTAASELFEGAKSFSLRPDNCFQNKYFSRPLLAAARMLLQRPEGIWLMFGGANIFLQLIMFIKYSLLLLKKGF